MSDQAAAAAAAAARAKQFAAAAAADASSAPVSRAYKPRDSHIVAFDEAIGLSGFCCAKANRGTTDRRCA